MQLSRLSILIIMIALINTITASDARVWHLSCCPTKTDVFASCGEDRVIKIWGFRNNLYTDICCIATLEEGHSRTIRCCEWSPDGLMLASASFDGKVVVWQTQDSTFAHWDQITSLEGHDNEVKSVAWSHNGVWLATCGRDKKVWIWERTIESDFECAAMLDGHTQDVKFVRWHPVLDVLLSCSYDDSIKIWVEDGNDWYCSQTLIGHNSTVWGASFADHGNVIVSCSEDKSMILWRTSDPSCDKLWVRTATLPDVHSLPVYSIDCSTDTDFVVSGSADNSLCLSMMQRINGTVTDISILSVYNNAHDGDVNCCRLLPNGLQLPPQDVIGSILLTCSDDGNIKVWHVTLA